MRSAAEMMQGLGPGQGSRVLDPRLPELSLHPTQLGQVPERADLGVMVAVQRRVVRVVALVVNREARLHVSAAVVERAALELYRPGAMMGFEKQFRILPASCLFQQGFRAPGAKGGQAPPAPIDWEVAGIFRQLLAQGVRGRVQLLGLYRAGAF